MVKKIIAVVVSGPPENACEASCILFAQQLSCSGLNVESSMRLSVISEWVFQNPLLTVEQVFDHFGVKLNALGNGVGLLQKDWFAKLALPNDFVGPVSLRIWGSNARIPHMFWLLVKNGQFTVHDFFSGFEIKLLQDKGFEVSICPNPAMSVTCATISGNQDFFKYYLGMINRRDSAKYDFILPFQFLGSTKLTKDKLVGQNV